MYIGGSWVTADETRPVINPADESSVAEVPEADAGHAEKALEAAKRSQREWARKTGAERGRVLRAIAEGIRARQEELAQLVVAEQGKTITEARGEVGEAAAGFFEYYATFERAQVGSMFAPDETNEHLIVRSVPYGVVVEEARGRVTHLTAGLGDRLALLRHDELGKLLLPGPDPLRYRP